MAKTKITKKKAPKTNIVKGYARLWPREVFDFTDGKGALIIKDFDALKECGVYILYRDDIPYYFGRAKILFNRLHAHSNQSGDPYFNYWNYFSFFVVDQQHVPEIEGILIASSPTANRSVPRIKKIAMTRDMVNRSREARRKRSEG